VKVAWRLTGSNRRPRVPVRSLRAQPASTPISIDAFAVAGSRLSQPESPVQTSGSGQTAGRSSGETLPSANVPTSALSASRCNKSGVDVSFATLPPLMQRSLCCIHRLNPPMLSRRSPLGSRACQVSPQADAYFRPSPIVPWAALAVPQRCLSFCRRSLHIFTEAKRVKTLEIRIPAIKMLFKPTTSSGSTRPEVRKQISVKRTVYVNISHPGQCHTRYMCAYT
jgi:hypothetical protein